MKLHKISEKASDSVIKLLFNLLPNLAIFRSVYKQMQIGKLWKLNIFQETIREWLCLFCKVYYTTLLTPGLFLDRLAKKYIFLDDTFGRIYQP